MAHLHFYVIAYDIQSNSSRKRIADLLENYGQRSNFSVFECMLSPAQMDRIVHRIEDWFDPETDRVLFYRACKSCFDNSFALGHPPEAPPMVQSI